MLAPVALVGNTAQGSDRDVVMSLGQEAGDGGGGAKDVDVSVSNSIGNSVAHFEIGLGAVGIPGEGGTGGSDIDDRDVVRIGAGSRGQHMQRVVMSHSPCRGEARIGGCGGFDGACVAVETAVSTCYAHAIDTSRLRGGNNETGGEDRGVGAGRSANKDNLVAVEGVAVVPVDPDDSTISEAGGIGDVQVNSVAGRHGTDHVVVVAIEG